MARKLLGVLIGTAGVYHVASELASKGFHAAVTYGNAPTVDILVGRLDGTAMLSLQVKTSHWALRTRGRGNAKSPHHYEWDVGQKSATLHRPDLFFAFVDLKSGSNQKPDVFIVPSKFIFDYFDNPYFKSGKRRRWRWHPSIKDVERFKNNWDVLDSFLIGKAERH